MEKIDIPGIILFVGVLGTFIFAVGWKFQKWIDYLERSNFPPKENQES